MENAEIRKAISDAGLKHWQVAAAAGISEATLCVWLRKPLTKDQKERVCAAVAVLSAKHEQEATR